jgi:hypothetical protein
MPFGIDAQAAISDAHARYPEAHTAIEAQDISRALAL